MENENVIQSTPFGVIVQREPDEEIGITTEYLPPVMPERLPEPIRLLISRTPEPMQSAVAMAVFPPLGAHLFKVRCSYWDNRDYEPAFMNIVVAPHSSGKSAVNRPIEYIMADIEERDERSRRVENEWKLQCSMMPASREHPPRPTDICIQSISADMTNATFVQRLVDAEGRTLYTSMDEIEMLNSLRTGHRNSNVGVILRLAFDRSKYGQERVGATSITGRASLRWNWNASTTPMRARSFFRHLIVDGTLSRISFATIVHEEENWGLKRYAYGAYGPEFATRLKPYIDLLNTCEGIIDCAEAKQWAEELMDELITFARDCENKDYALLSRRAVLIAFFRAIVLYIMNGRQWSDEIAQFCAWTARYDMWCKMRFFGDFIREELEGENKGIRPGPRNLLDMLPTEFSRQDLADMRRLMGKDSKGTLNQLGVWKNRGYIVETERFHYKKQPQAPQ